MFGVTCWTASLMCLMGAEPTASDIVDAWEAGCLSIISYRLDVELTEFSYADTDKQGNGYMLPDPSKVLPRVSRSRILRSANKRRGDFHLEDPKLIPSSIINDGEKCLIIDPNGKLASIQRGVLAYGVTQYEDYESCYRNILGSVSWVEETRKRDYRLLPREGKLFVLDVPFAKTTNEAFFNFRWRVWLDPDKNFMPTQITQRVDSQGQQQLESTIENTLKEVAAGVWIPIVSLRKTYAVGGPKDPLIGQLIGTSTLTVGDKSEFNVDIDPKLFVIDVPFGYQVNDQIRNISYTKGSTDPDRFLAELTKNAATGLKKMSKNDRRPPTTLFLPESWWFRNRIWLSWTASIALLLVAALTVRRVRLARGVA